MPGHRAASRRSCLQYLHWFGSTVVEYERRHDLPASQNLPNVELRVLNGDVRLDKQTVRLWSRLLRRGHTDSQDHPDHGRYQLLVHRTSRRAAHLPRPTTSPQPGGCDAVRTPPGADCTAPTPPSGSFPSGPPWPAIRLPGTSSSGFARLLEGSRSYEFEAAAFWRSFAAFSRYRSARLVSPRRDANLARASHTSGTWR